VDVRRFVRKIRFGNFRGAARLIRQANLMVGTCGRVCPQEILCMEHCVRGELDTPIDIAGLQRYAGDVEVGTLAPMPDDVPEQEKKVAVIGSGPAGLGAAADLLKRGFVVEIFERSQSLGGVLALGVPPFRLDRSFLDGELDYVRRLGAVVHFGSDAEDPATMLERGFDAVMIGVGLWRPYRIGLPGEDLEGVYIAADFLEAAAVGEAPDVEGRVVVIGGGNVAMDAAVTCLRLGAARVDLCSLESYEELPAFRSEVEATQREGVEFHTRTKPVRIVGREGRVCGYEGVGIRWKKPGLLVPTNAEEIPGSAFSLPATAVIEAIGQGVRDRYDGVDTDDRGLIRVDSETMVTSMKGVFAAGDVVNGGATAVQAYAEGKRAAAGIETHLSAGEGGERR
jgi:NADPH-dependent glutamate synthase beta subunit-like oxidoreductase